MPDFHLLLSVGLLAVCVYGLWQTSARNNSWQIVFWPALAFKLICGVLIGLFYAGCCDTFLYQHSSELLTSFGAKEPAVYFRMLMFNEVPEQIPIPFKTFSNSFFFIKVLSLLNFISGNNYYLNGLFISVFSFAGCWFLVRILSEIFSGTAKAAVVAFLFFPSVVFWNAGVTKDAVLMGTLCFFWGVVLKTVYFPGKKLWVNFLLVLFFSWLLFKIKLFIALIVFGLTASWLLLRWSRKRFTFLRTNRNFIGFVLVFFVFTGSILLLFLQRFANAFFYRHLVWNYETLRQQSAGRPIIELHDLKPEFFSVLSNVPEAVFGALFRPFVWEGEYVFYRVAGFENLLLMLLFLGSIPVLMRLQWKSVPGFYWVLIAFIVIMVALIGLTTPNLGSLNRYRTVFLPFLVYLLLQAPFWQNLLRQLKLKFLNLHG